jgi:hypothetical protein
MSLSLSLFNAFTYFFFLHLKGNPNSHFWNPRSSMFFERENSKSLYEIHDFQCFFGNKTMKPNNTYLFMHDLQGLSWFVFLHWKTYCWIHDDLQSLTNLFGVTLKEFGVHLHSHNGVSALILQRWKYLLPYLMITCVLGGYPKNWA